MEKIAKIALFLALIIAIGFVTTRQEPLTGEILDGVMIEADELEIISKPNSEVREFLESKNSPLAPYTDLLLEQEHWKLIIAISAIESTYCKHQLGNNCWGITDTSGAYKSYPSFAEAIVDANGLITRWQARGRWLTVDDMNCHYVVPCNPTWVSVVNTVLEQLETYERNRRLPQEK